MQQLLKARRVLKCSYVYGYYLDGPGYKKIVFEFMQVCCPILFTHSFCNGKMFWIHVDLFYPKFMKREKNCYHTCKSLSMAILKINCLYWAYLNYMYIILCKYIMSWYLYPSLKKKSILLNLLVSCQWLVCRYPINWHVQQIVWEHFTPEASELMGR